MSDARLARRGRTLAWAVGCVLPMLATGCGESAAHTPPVTVRQTAVEFTPAATPAAQTALVETVSYKTVESPALSNAEAKPDQKVVAASPGVGSPASDVATANAIIAEATARPDTIAAEAVTRGAKDKLADKPAASAAPRKVEILIKDKTFTTDKQSGALRVSYDDLDLLKVLNMEPVTLDAVEKMPEWLKQLNGKRVRIRGFMYPTFQETGLSRFILARDNQICCFGRAPKVYDLIEIKMKSGITTDYIQNRPFDVVGDFRIKMGEMLDEGLISGLYFIDDAIVIEK